MNWARFSQDPVELGLEPDGNLLRCGEISAFEGDGRKSPYVLTRTFTLCRSLGTPEFTRTQEKQGHRPLTRQKPEPKNRFGACLDVSDTILECATAARSDFLVTGDKHPLKLGSFRWTRIIKPAAFLALVCER
jgi:hypothetical protein